MKRRKLLWLIGVLAVSAPLIGFLVFRSHGSNQELRKELDLARSEGLFTSEEQFKASISTASPAENAAFFYKELPERNGEDPNELTKALVYQPSESNLVAAQEVLSKNRPILSLLDQAVKRPRCWFDRDWSMGAGVLFPEFASMKHGAKLLCLRGSVAAHNKRPAEALADIRRVFQVARHTGEEGHSLSRLVEISIHRIGMVTLAGWVLQNPDQPAYREELARTNDVPEFDLRRLFDRDLLDVMSIIDLCSTKEGREKLGLREEDVSRLEPLAPLLRNRRGAKVAVISAMRKRWAALESPPSEMQDRWDEASAELSTALLAFPTAASVYYSLSGDVSPYEQQRHLEAERQKYTALVRALSQYPIPKTLRTSDLLSPYDQKPLIYRYQKGVITIEVSGHESRLQLPPEPSKTRRQSSAILQNSAPFMIADALV